MADMATISLALCVNRYGLMIEPDGKTFYEYQTDNLNIDEIHNFRTNVITS